MDQYGAEKDRASWALHFAMVKADIVQPKRTHKVDVKGTTKSGKSYTYTYKYADLADVDKAVMDAVLKTAQDEKPLLSYYFDIDNGEQGVSVQTVVVDAKTGFMMKMNRVWFKNFNVGDAQKTASLISYAKRYSLSATFGIASEDDDDANNVDETPKRDVNDAGLKVIWNSYINDHSEKAKKWIVGPHDPVTAHAINKLLVEYKSKQGQKDIKKTKAKNEKSEDETIKEIVDGKPKKEDPFKDEKKDAEPTDQQQDLFNDILGG